MLLYKPVVLAQKKNLPMLYFKHLHNKGVNMAKSLVSKNKQAGDTKIIHALDRRASCYADIVINYFR